MEIEVRYYTVLREITGHRFEKISLKPNSSVKDLLNYLVEKYGEKFDTYIFNSNRRFTRNISLILNGENIQGLQGFDTKLDKDDVISFLPPVGGG